jgi:NADH:ubiquinone oxidoreductase subunit D
VEKSWPISCKSSSARNPRKYSPLPFVNLQILTELLRGYKMSDVIAIMGSLDFVVGEVDR